MTAKLTRQDVIRHARDLQARPWQATMSNDERSLILHFVAPTEQPDGGVYELTDEARLEALALIERRDDALQCYLDLRELFLDARKVQ